MRWIALGIAAVMGVGIAAAAETKPVREPNTLFIGEQVLSPEPRNRLTHEQWVSDFDFSPQGDSIAFAAGGFNTVQIGIVSHDGERILKVEIPGSPGHVAWSPDGKSLAAVTTGRPPGAATALWLVRAEGGEPRRLLSGAEIGVPVWSPDGKMLAFNYRERAGQKPAERGADILTLNLEDGSRRLVGEQGTDLRFSPDARLLLFRTVAQDNEGNSLHQRVQYDLATGEKQRQPMRFGGGFFSLDGTKVVIQTSQPYGDLVVRDLREGPPLRLTWNGASKFGAWSPDGRLVAYIRNYPLSDDRGETLVTGPTLWAVAVTGVDTGRQILVNPRVDYGCPVRWSPAGDAVALVADGDLWMVTLMARPMMIRERRSVGLPITEEAVRHEAVMNARQIGMALLMYANDHDEALPPSGSEIPLVLQPYLRSQELFYHPAEPDKFIFKYLLEEAATLDDIGDATKTPMALLDLDAEWEVVCFANGHAVARRKQK